MIASRGLTISGSGTLSTRTSWRPCQVTARMSCSLNPCFGGAFGTARRRRRVHRHLARLHELLEPAEIAARLEARLSLKQFCDAAADGSARRVVAHQQS